MSLIERFLLSSTQIFTRVAIVAALTTGVVLLAAPPASAHDDLVSSTPDSGDRLDAVPDTISLTYSDELLPIGAEVIVVSGDGRDWVNGEPEITQTTVTVQLLPEMPAAGYEVRWRVVSSDGHPISGIVPFTVGDADPLVRTPTASDAPEDDPDQSSQPGDRESADVLRVVVIGVAGAAAAIAIYLGFRFVRSRRRASLSSLNPKDRNP